MAKLTNTEKRKALRSRLARVEGQLRGVQQQLDQGAECEAIAQQLSAARKALDKSFFAMVACVIEQGDAPPEQVARLLAKFA
jgi:CsoR family transcriptional regulator, copper-sensing transcriptional repressor